MKFFRVVASVSLWWLLSIAGFGQFEEKCISGSSGTQANWEQDKTHLASIFSCMSIYPMTSGYIGYYSSPKYSEKKVTKRIDEAVGDLKIRFPRESGRVLVKYLGISDDAKFYSQILPEDFPAPWERPAQNEGPLVVLTFTPGWPDGHNYTDKDRFVLSFPDDTLIADVINDVRRQLQNNKMELHHPLYLALANPKTGKLIDPKKSIRDCVVVAGTTLWITSTVR